MPGPRTRGQNPRKTEKKQFPANTARSHNLKPTARWEKDTGKNQVPRRRRTRSEGPFHNDHTARNCRFCGGLVVLPSQEIKGQHRQTHFQPRTGGKHEGALFWGRRTRHVEDDLPVAGMVPSSSGVWTAGCLLIVRRFTMDMIMGSYVLCCTLARSSGPQEARSPPRGAPRSRILRSRIVLAVAWNTQNLSMYKTRGRTRSPRNTESFLLDCLSTTSSLSSSRSTALS